MLWVLACAPDPCENVCNQALQRQESCMAERGLGWESSAYADAVDFQSGCVTWVWEVGELGLDQCDVMKMAILEGTCEDFDAAWRF